MAVGDTVRLRCEEGPVLAPSRRHPTGVVADRLLTADDDLLVVTKDGALLRYAGLPRAPAELLDGGKDYDARNDVVVRLSADRIEAYRYRHGRVSPEAVQPAAGHDLSIALGSGSLYLHSPVHPGNVLVVRRDRTRGAESGAFLAVERDLVRLLLSGGDEILQDTGFVRGLDDGFAFVPLIRDPIEIFAGRRVTLFLAGGHRGSIRTTSREVEHDERPCPTCDEHREVKSRQEVRRLYADAVADPRGLWILRLDPPGTGNAVLLWYSFEESTVKAWRLPRSGTPPRAMTIWRSSLVVGGDGYLDTYDLPGTGEAGICHP